MSNPMREQVNTETGGQKAAEVSQPWRVHQERDLPGLGSWQPIETAPKMRAILLYNNAYTVGHWNDHYQRWIAYGSDTADTIALNRHKPTHWMPLPDAPLIPQERFNE